jgi:hypothetical protein
MELEGLATLKREFDELVAATEKASRAERKAEEAENADGEGEAVQLHELGKEDEKKEGDALL